MEDRIKELISEAINNNYITYTYYLTPNEYKMFNDKYNGLKVIKSGKLRKMLAFIPEYQEEYVEFPETLIRIEVNNKFREYTNKDFLGSIMSLNIDRKYIGDIFVFDNNAYVYASNKVLNIVLSLDRVAKNNCIVEIFKDDINLDFKYEIKNYTISSIRFDNVVSAITNMSRTKSKEYIELGLCQLDYNIELNPSKELKKDMIISIKSYGRYIYNGIIKESKKGKPVIEIKKFL